MKSSVVSMPQDKFDQWIKSEEVAVENSGSKTLIEGAKVARKLVVWRVILSMEINWSGHLLKIWQVSLRLLW